MSRIGACLIVNAYPYWNAGDAAIMLATRDLLVDIGASNVTLSSRYDDGDSYRQHGLPVLKELVPFASRGEGSAISRLVAFAVSIGGSLVAVAIARTNRQWGQRALKFMVPRAYAMLSNTDTLVIAGGGYMYSSKRRFNLSLLHSMLSIKVGQVMAMRTMMMPQSIGPLHRKLDQTLLDWALGDTTAVVRERLSNEKSRHPSRSADRANLVPDIAFYLKAPAKTTEYGGRPVARLVVMDWTWSRSVDGSKYDQYIYEMARLGDLLAGAGYRVIVGGHSALPEHGQDDIETARAVTARAKAVMELDSNCDVGHLLNEYAAASVVIGTRLHSCIMAVAQGTPAIAIAYQEKAVGVMANADLKDYVFMADGFDAMDVMDRVRAIEATGRGEWKRASESRVRAIRDYYAKDAAGFRRDEDEPVA